MNFINSKKEVRIFMMSKKIEKNYPLRSYKSKEKVDGFCSMLMGFVPYPYWFKLKSALHSTVSRDNSHFVAVVVTLSDLH